MDFTKKLLMDMGFKLDFWEAYGKNRELQQIWNLTTLHHLSPHKKSLKQRNDRPWFLLHWELEYCINIL